MPVDSRIERLAKIVLMMGSLVSFLVFLYFSYFYAWTKEKEFTEATGIFVSLVVPGLVASGLFAALRLSPAYKIRLAIFSLLLVFSIYSLEFLLVTARRFVSRFDQRSRLEVVRDLRSRGIDAVPAIFPSILWEQQDGIVRSSIKIEGAEVLPLGGIAQKLTVMCNESGEWVTYTSDEHGFNNPAGIWRLAEMSIAALGDSFAFGACVPADRNFVALIRNNYPATLNLGINGAGPLVELAALKEFLPAFKPQVTLWFYLELNDQDELKQEQRSALLVRYLRESFKQGLLTKQGAIDSALAQYVETKRREADNALRNVLHSSVNVLKLSHLRNSLGLIHARSQAEASIDSDQFQITLFRQILQHAQAFTDAWGGRFYFVYLPSWERYAGTALRTDHREVLLALIRALGIPVIDIHRAFEARGDPLRFFPFRRRGHYNEEGHRVVAATILSFLAADGATVRGRQMYPTRK